LIYVDDVIECLLLLGETDQCVGEVYAIGADERVTFVDLVKEIIRACGSGSYTHVPWPEDRKIIEVGDIVTDHTKLTDHTGWVPSVRLSEGLKITAEYYRKYKEHYW
jgi:nucleoside-diphosphate-sugar epimerase